MITDGIEVREPRFSAVWVLMHEIQDSHARSIP